MLQLFYLYLSLVLGGAGLVIGIWFLYRNRTRGKIICYFYTKSRHLYKKALRPTKLGIIELKGKSFAYKEEHIFYTQAFLFREPFAALLFNEDMPNPVSLSFLEATGAIERMESPDGEVGSSELSKIMNDSTVDQFVNAQSRINLSQVTGVIVGTGLAVAATVVAVGYWIKGLA